MIEPKFTGCLEGGCKLEELALTGINLEPFKRQEDMNLDRAP